MSIPRVIHYCWLSGEPYPEFIRNCLESWNKVLKDYTIVLWDFERIKEIKSVWLDSTIRQKKWSFAADYVRCYALYNYGGIYLDSDVEVKKNFDTLLHLPYFVGKEKRGASFEAAVVGSKRNEPWLKWCLDFYENKTFEPWMRNQQEYLLPVIMRVLVEKMYKKIILLNSVPSEYDEDVFHLFNADFFSPLDNMLREPCISPNTYAVHWFNGAWESPYQKKYKEIKKFFYKRNVPWLGFIFANLFALKEKIKQSYEH